MLVSVLLVLEIIITSLANVQDSATPVDLVITSLELEQENVTPLDLVITLSDILQEDMHKLLEYTITSLDHMPGCMLLVLELIITSLVFMQENIIPLEIVIISLALMLDSVMRLELIITSLVLALVLHSAIPVVDLIITSSANMLEDA